MKTLSEKEAKKIFKQLAEAIKYCHDNKVLHLDVKLDNIMYTKKTGEATLIDFGLCDFITEEHGDLITRRVGSLEYSPPEIFVRSETPFYGTKVDVWCLGVVLYSLLSSMFPFDPKKRSQLLRRGTEHPPVIFNFILSSKAKDLLTKMLALKPEQRITIDEVLKHPWLK